MELPRPRKREIRIDISALVDVIFLLLIFFAVSTTFLETEGLDLELPAARTAERHETQELAVWIGAAGELRFRGDDLTLAGLEPALEEALARSERKLVVLRADRKVPLERVVAVMDLARRAGARGLTIASEERP